MSVKVASSIVLGILGSERYSSPLVSISGLFTSTWYVPRRPILPRDSWRSLWSHSILRFVTWQLVGRSGAGSFSQFVDIPLHVFHMRSMSWMLVILVPIVGMVFDVTGKVFSNMFFPTQTQIHVEIFCTQKDKAEHRDANDTDGRKLTVQEPNV